MSIKNPRYTIGRRRKLRKDMTRAEALLWEEVRGKKIEGVRVRRQYGVGPYIIDFFIPSVNLAVEVDGKIHLKREVKEKDRNKDAFLKENGIHIVRITNDEVLNDIKRVKLKLKGRIKELKEKGF
ncbi:MAG: endonuclease domain-containing protein [Balneolaceae bacterium]